MIILRESLNLSVFFRNVNVSSLLLPLYQWPPLGAKISTFLIKIKIKARIFMVQGILKIISKLSSVLVNMMWPLKYCQNLHDTCTDIVCKFTDKVRGREEPNRMREHLDLSSWCSHSSCLPDDCWYWLCSPHIDLEMMWWLEPPDHSSKRISIRNISITMTTSPSGPGRPRPSGLQLAILLSLGE